MIITGDNGVSLRLITINDAQFTLDLRTDSTLNEHISATSANLKDQINFITEYKKREEQGLEYYFIIEYKGESVGTARIYNIDKENKTCTWGSWMIKQGCLPIVSISSVYLAYYTIFKILEYNKVFFDVRIDNLPVCRFHKLYATFIKITELDEYFEFTEKNFTKYTLRFKTFLPKTISYQ